MATTIPVQNKAIYNDALYIYDKERTLQILKADNLACPIDGSHLTTQDKQLVCSNGHTFDIARQGYINLLPVQQKRSKHPGDSKMMVLARAQFLNAGYYQSIAQAIAETIGSLIPDEGEINLLDAGCGEGYYFDYLLNHLSHINQNSSLSFIGLDISKEAIEQSSKRNKQITWLVGTNRQPPVQDSSVDIILCVFGFVSYEGFLKVLKPGGKIILVDPGSEHLQELRKIIYQKDKEVSETDISEIKTDDFSIIDAKYCHFKTGDLGNEDIKNLLAMTPHMFRANKEGKEATNNLQSLDLTVDVVIRTLVIRER